jgi:glycosyltransferase involved in cell wall biosynthesis
MPKEIILIDDFSDDGELTLRALSEIRNSNPQTHIIIVPLEKNDGPGTARNIGWSYASQPYIAFLDADDSWHPKKIEIQYGWMKLNPTIAFSFHRSKQIKSNEKVSFDLPEFCAKPRALKFLLRSNFVPTRTVMLKTSLSLRFYPGKRYAEDYLLWLRIAYTEGDLWLIDSVLSYSYKSDFGEGGLNQMLYKSYLGVLDTYKKILRDSMISRLTYCLLVTYASMKFIRRILLVYFRGSLS